jgi:hypothetical protein
MIRLKPKEKSKGFKRTPMKRKTFKRKPQIFKTRNSKTEKAIKIKIEVSKIPPKKIAFLTKTPPKIRIVKTPDKLPPKTKLKRIRKAIDKVITKRKSKGLRIKIDPLDQLFSTYIRTRDNFTCQRCGVESKNVQCAHFIGRRNQNCRFNEKSELL